MAENWQNMAKNVSNVFHDLKNLRIAQRSLKICQFWRILATFAPITFHDGCRCFYLRYVIHSRRKSDTFIVFFLFHGSAPSLNLEKAIKWGCYILNVFVLLCERKQLHICYKSARIYRIFKGLKDLKGLKWEKGPKGPKGLLKRN
jgi:hypothetical protein